MKGNPMTDIDHAAERVRPCKYCRSAVAVKLTPFNAAGGTAWVVRCGGCGAGSDKLWMKSDAIKSWNTLHNKEIIR